ncbi:MAG: hypothetical protein HY810_05865 [Candidatus Omnitrophica bacterium]|nr:hypothetical protein [Candidatus Omnitrophota bacterium]
MKEQYNELKEDVLDEEEAIDETIEKLCRIRGNFDPQKRDNLIEPAMGTYLMNFYNGIENILKRVSKEYYSVMPRGNNWHKELLILSYNAPVGKIPIFEQAIAERIIPYKNFRHRFVSGYGFQLNGEKMLGLIDNAELLWEDIKKAISEFFIKL